jgi:hypothetical protein
VKEDQTMPAMASPAEDVNVWSDLAVAVAHGCHVVALKKLSAAMDRSPTLDEVNQLAQKMSYVYLTAIRDGVLDKKVQKKAGRALNLALELGRIQFEMSNQGGVQG